MTDKLLEMLTSSNRSFTTANTGDELLGPLKELPGIWKNLPNLNDRGWNLIALPFIHPNAELNINYRILVNQYNEELKFSLVDKKVPNRGVIRQNSENLDQLIVTLDYEQAIIQKAAADFPPSADSDEDRAGGDCLPIHHEPGLWLNMKNHTTRGIDIARLGTIPHGNAVMALGKSVSFEGPPVIPDIDTLPIGATRDLYSNYLKPYRHFSNQGRACDPMDTEQGPFLGLLDVLSPSDLLRAATPSNVVRTTMLKVKTNIESGGISNIPFISKHADATEMESTFWIMETDEKDEKGCPIFIMQYMQIVMLDFFDRFDDEDGLIKWPHVSFNTMRRFPLETDTHRFPPPGCNAD